MGKVLENYSSPPPPLPLLSPSCELEEPDPSAPDEFRFCSAGRAAGRRKLPSTRFGNDYDHGRNNIAGFLVW